MLSCAGSSGWLCESCLPDYYKLGDQCISCTSSAVGVVGAFFMCVLIVLIVGAIGLGAWFEKGVHVQLVDERIRKTRLVSVATLVICFLQSCGLLSRMRLQWSPSVLHLLQIFDFANFNFRKFQVCPFLPPSQLSLFLSLSLSPFVCSLACADRVCAWYNIGRRLHHPGDHPARAAAHRVCIDHRIGRVVLQDQAAGAEAGEERGRPAGGGPAQRLPFAPRRVLANRALLDRGKLSQPLILCCVLLILYLIAVS